MQGQGVYQFTVMQSISKAFQVGCQYVYMPQPMAPKFSLGQLSWAAFYQAGDKNKHQFAACYVPQ